MKLKDYKCKCGRNDFFFADKGNQKGVYCSYCGKWLKWADKDEQNLIMNQKSVIEELEKIQAEMDNKGWYNRHDKEQFAEIVDNHISELKGENK